MSRFSDSWPISPSIAKPAVGAAQSVTALRYRRAYAHITSTLFKLNAVTRFGHLEGHTPPSPASTGLLAHDRGRSSEFTTASELLALARPRPEAGVTAIAAPQDAAPGAIAYQAFIAADHAQSTSPSLMSPLFPPRMTTTPEPGASGHRAIQAQMGKVESGIAATAGRFMVLHDPNGQPGWDGHFRIVSYIRAQVGPELAADPLLTEVAWSWLAEGLSTHGLSYERAGGTVTRMHSESFGTLSPKAADDDVELRASWTPELADIGDHLEAWSDIVCMVAGIAPLPERVTALPYRRRT